MCRLSSARIFRDLVAMRSDGPKVRLWKRAIASLKCLDALLGILMNSGMVEGVGTDETCNAFHTLSRVY